MADIDYGIVSGVCDQETIDMFYGRQAHVP